MFQSLIAWVNNTSNAMADKYKHFNKTHNRKTKRQGSVKHKQSKKKFPWRHEFKQNLKEYV